MVMFALTVIFNVLFCSMLSICVVMLAPTMPGCNPPKHDPSNMVCLLCGAAASSGSGMWRRASWHQLFVAIWGVNNSVIRMYRHSGFYYELNRVEVGREVVFPLHLLKTLVQ